MSVTYADWVSKAQSKLTSISESARLDSQLILAHALNKDMTHLLTWPDKSIPENLIHALQALLGRRLAGEPMAYILGQCEFWGLTLDVNSDVLIPRADTEVVIETILKVVNDLGLEQPRILDLGTGSGAIAIALASELPIAKVTAVDVSSAALTVAQLNANKHRLKNISFVVSNWFDAITGQAFDIIVSNPPYIAEADPHLASLVYEPEIALTAKDAGYADLALLIQQAPDYAASGWLFLEHGYNQSEKVRHIMQQCDYQQVVSVKDLAGHERCTFGKIPNHG
ncbi:MAG: peptide chain release factor N(5)-glutamine methyltransferase [Gammaproteobacteria bacterium]|nr:peptide chain release factor N(5)-glutamine methyltransferase [Gammaproteobacteria bacterium]NNJ73460.1 peptide chain release factor N(5)-glutamine methyltransferase [Enterobacterales bacterium]